MKKSELNKLFANRAKRKKKIVVYLTTASFLLLLALLFFNLYVGQNKNKYIYYNESGNVDYRVYLTDNKFFKEEYLSKDNEYIANLIDYIDTDFKYNIKFDSNKVGFRYFREIEAEVVVKNLNGKKPLYVYKEELLKKKENNSIDNELNIEEKIKIDYLHFNDIATEFKNTYNLPNADAELIVKMYVEVIGDCEEFEENKSSKSELNLTIPLTTKTMAIEIANNLVANDDNIIVCNSNGLAILFLIISIILIVAMALVIIMLSIYVIKNRTAHDIYEIELKKILNNYHSFIQKITNDFDYDNYKILNVEEFTDLLELRDTLNKPILMIENKGKTIVKFIIPTPDKLLYMYNLKERDIKNKLEIEK